MMLDLRKEEAKATVQNEKKRKTRGREENDNDGEEKKRENIRKKTVKKEDE